MPIDTQYWRMTERAAHLTEDSFALADGTVEDPGPGQVLTRTRFISLDPYLTRFMQEWAGEVAGWTDGTVHGRVISEVIVSRADGFSPGDHVYGVGRWQSHNLFDASELDVVPPRVDPPSLAVGVVGRSGMTSWVGVELAELQPGQTFVVSAATGPVGSVAGQLAKAKGCRVVGIAGGADKCRYAVDDLGLDACVDHHGDDLVAAVAAAAPDGVDVVFENVGAPTLDPVLPSMNRGGKVLLCGLVAHYNERHPTCFAHFKEILWRSITIQAFATASYPEWFDRAVDELMAGVESGAIRYHETITHGLEHAPTAYLSMLGGGGMGKRLVCLD